MGDNLKMPIHWKDFELDAVVKCSLADDNPAYNPNNEYANLVAVVAGSQKYRMYEPEDGLTWAYCDIREGSSGRMSTWGEGLPRIKEFQQVPFCFLFHEVFQHTLHGDLVSLLRIGEIEIVLTLVRQRGFVFEEALLPRKRQYLSPRSVFGRTPCSRVEPALTSRELRYAHLLNQKLGDAQAWIEEEARRGEQEYLSFEWRDYGLASDKTHEDYQMMMEVSGCLGENHPEYDEYGNNIVVQYSQPISTEKQQIFGRGRYIFHPSRYGCYFAPGSRGQGAPFGKIAPCGLFWNIFGDLDRDWLKMLSIGQLWLDVAIMQRLIVQL